MGKEGNYKTMLKIMRYLCESDGPVKLKDVAEVVGVSRVTARISLRRLMNRGLVVQPRTGYYVPRGEVCGCVKVLSSLLNA